MNDNRDCEHCAHHTEQGCSSWSCEFELRMTEAEIRADERKKFADWCKNNNIQCRKKLGGEWVQFGVNEIVDEYEDGLKGGAEDTKVADLNQKCGSCKWLNKEKKTSVGYVCENPNKKWRTRTAQYKQKTCKACKEYEKKDY